LRERESLMRLAGGLRERVSSEMSWDADATTDQIWRQWRTAKCRRVSFDFDRSAHLPAPSPAPINPAQPRHLHGSTPPSPVTATILRPRLWCDGMWLSCSGEEVNLSTIFSPLTTRLISTMAVWLLSSTMSLTVPVKMAVASRTLCGSSWSTHLGTSGRCRSR